MLNRVQAETKGLRKTSLRHVEFVADALHIDFLGHMHLEPLALSGKKSLNLVQSRRQLFKSGLHHTDLVLQWTPSEQVAVGVLLSSTGGDIMPSMAKNVIHISEAEAARDFAGLLARVRAGGEIVIGDEARPVAVVRPAEPHVRLLSESLRLAKEHASTATLDEGFASDLEEVINSHREPLNPPTWE